MRTRRDYAHTRGPEIHLHRARVSKVRESGIDVVDLGYADVSVEPPDAVIREIRDRIAGDKSVHHYGDVQGMQDLRCAIADYLSEDSATISSDNVIITAGANHAVVLALLATTVPGDKVAIPAPFFFNHVTQIQLIGCSHHPLLTYPEDNYALGEASWERALARPDVGAALLTNPRNPTTTQFGWQELDAMLVGAEDRQRAVIVDESYREFSVDRRLPTWKKDGATIRLGSLSKSFCLAGWRMGYMVVPDLWLERVIDAQDALMIHPAIASQDVALAALRTRKQDNYVQRISEDIAMRRRLARERILTCDWVLEVFADAGTFIWVRLREGCNADEIATRLLLEAGVGVLSGAAFGRLGNDCLRVGVGCITFDELTQGLERLVRWRV